MSFLVAFSKIRKTMPHFVGGATSGMPHGFTFPIYRDNETSNLVDNLLKRLELYAKNLEGLVEERTREYLAEKQKVEDLLHQLLPPSIADQVSIN